MVPLVSKISNLPQNTKNLVLLDSIDNKISVFDKTKPKLRNANIKVRERCKDYDVKLHKSVIKDTNSSTTLLMSHLYTEKRHDTFVYLIKHYCKMKCVDRIIVAWHSLQYEAPSTSFCPGDPDTMILYEKFETDSLLNRFTPTELILTPSVVTLDNDILVSEFDLMAMIRLWSLERHKIVGPFVRWVDKNDEYAYSYKNVKEESYIVVLTKFHISSSDLFRKFFATNNMSTSDVLLTNIQILKICCTSKWQ